MEPDGDLDRLRHGWAEVLAAVSARPSLKAIIKECRPVAVDGNVITLGFPEEKSFMRDVADGKRAQFEPYFERFLGHPVGIRCVVSNLELLPPLPADQEAAHILSEAHRIFADDRLDVPDIT